MNIADQTKKKIYLISASFWVADRVFRILNNFFNFLKPKIKICKKVNKGKINIL